MAIDNGYDGEAVDGATNFQKREIAVSNQSSPTDIPPSSPADKAKAHRRQSTETRTDTPTMKSTRMLLKPPVESATMKSTGWSRKRSSNGYYRIKMCLRVKSDAAEIPDQEIAHGSFRRKLRKWRFRFEEQRRGKEMMSMPWCRAAITLTQSRTRSIAWICSVGSCFPTAPSTDDYRLQDILYRTCGSTAQSSDTASALDLGKYNHLRETYVLGVYEWDYTKLTYTIDRYDRCRQWKLPSMRSHERKLYHPNECQQWPKPRYTGYECGTGWLVGRCMSSGVETRRNWGPWLTSGGNGSIEFRNSILEERYQFGVPFFCFSLLFSSLLHLSLLLWISAR